MASLLLAPYFSMDKDFFYIFTGFVHLSLYPTCNVILVSCNRQKAFVRCVRIY